MADIGSAAKVAVQQQIKQQGQLEFTIIDVRTDPKQPHEALVHIASAEGVPLNMTLLLDPTNYRGGIQQGNRLTVIIYEDEARTRADITAIYSGQDQVYAAAVRK